MSSEIASSLALLAMTKNVIASEAKQSHKKGQMAKKYTILLDPNYPEEGHIVRVPALPGCITYGQTREEALERAKEAIEGFIEGLQKTGEAVPKKVTATELETVIVQNGSR